MPFRYLLLATLVGGSKQTTVGCVNLSNFPKITVDIVHYFVIILISAHTTFWHKVW